MSHPYGSHLPTLQRLGRHLRVERVLEFGAGEYSTLGFLRRDDFPDLVSLISVEPDPMWRDRVRFLTVGDSRLAIVKDIVEGLSRLNEPFDLILIDNGAQPSERVPVIVAVAGMHLHHTAVVIHDFENPLYQEAARGFEKVSIFDMDLPPWTAILWNGAYPELEPLAP